MYKWYLPTLGEIIQATESSVIQQTRQQRSHHLAEQDWYGAIAALNIFLASQVQSHTEDEVLINALPIGGLIISGPFSVLTQADLVSYFSHWTLTTDPFYRLDTPPQLPSAEVMMAGSCVNSSVSSAHRHTRSVSPTLSLHPDDPLLVEPFCLVLTPKLSMVLTLGLDDHHMPQFLLSFDPDTIWQGWRSLRSRLQVTNPAILPQLDQIANQFAPSIPDYRAVMEFSQLLLLLHGSPEQAKHKHHVSAQSTPQLPLQDHFQGQCSQATQKSGNCSEDVNRERSRYPRKPLNRNRTERLKLDTVSWREVVESDRSNPSSQSGARSSETKLSGVSSTERSATELSKRAVTAKTSSPLSSRGHPNNEVPQPEIGSDIELLKAIAHEVRTPLTTIRTLTRLLLRSNALGEKVIQRLQQIDRECTKQIDRFSLIFRAVELKTTAVDQPTSPLATISLARVVQQNVSRWEHQAQQRNLTLEVVLPQTLPNVMSDPTMLNQVLTGLMDRMTHTLPAGTQIQLSAVPAGHQLKLQFWAKPNACSEATSCLPAKDVPTSPLSVSPSSPSATPKVNECSIDSSSTTATNRLHSIFSPTLQAVGQLLMFQPETGNLSLNLEITKNLFQSLGGKLIVRHTPQKGEVLTIFLPMEQDTSGELASQLLKGNRFC